MRETLYESQNKYKTIKIKSSPVMCLSDQSLTSIELLTSLLVMYKIKMPWKKSIPKKLFDCIRDTLVNWIQQNQMNWSNEMPVT